MRRNGQAPTQAGRLTQLLRRTALRHPLGGWSCRWSPKSTLPPSSSIQLCPAINSPHDRGRGLAHALTHGGWPHCSLAGGPPALPISTVSLVAAGPCPLSFHSLPTVKASRDPVHVEETTPSSPSVTALAVTAGGSQDALACWTPPTHSSMETAVFRPLVSCRLLSRAYLLRPLQSGNQQPSERSLGLALVGSCSRRSANN